MGHALQSSDKDFPVESPKIKEAYLKEGDEELGELADEMGKSKEEPAITTGRYLIIN